MTLVNLKELYKKAEEGGYAIVAVNVENSDMVRAVLEAAEEQNSPVIMQTTPGTLKSADVDFFYGMVSSAAKNSKAPVVLHLDHGSSFELAIKAIKAGYTSVMIDGSHGPFEDNVAISKKVAEVANALNISVEAELGRVGGKEDDLDGGVDDTMTIPSEAKEFVERTKCTSLAVGIGTSHGVYKGEPKVSIERLKEINDVVDIPLVMHGTSGVSDDVVREAVKNGIRKVNYATDLRIAYTKAVRKYLEEDKEVFDPKKYGQAGKEAVKAYIMQKMEVLGSVNKA